MDVLGIGFVRNIFLLYLLAIYFGVCDSQEERSVRVVDGETPREGRVEIYFDGLWGTVSLDGWTNKEAVVVCRQLGFDGPVVTKELGPADIGMEVPVLSVTCPDDERSLTECQIEKTEGSTMEVSLDYFNGMTFWDHDKNAGVECKQAESNVAIIIINVVGGLVMIALICFCVFLLHRLLNKRAVPKERPTEENEQEEQPESMAMYSKRIEKDYSEIPADQPGQYSSINPAEREPENAYETANNPTPDNPEQA